MCEIPRLNRGRTHETGKLEYRRGGWNSRCSGEMRRYREEHLWRRRPPGRILTLIRESGGANRIRYPGSPRCKRWALGVRGIDPLGAAANALSAPPGEYGRK